MTNHWEDTPECAAEAAIVQISSADRQGEPSQVGRAAGGQAAPPADEPRQGHRSDFHVTMNSPPRGGWMHILFGTRIIPCVRVRELAWLRPLR